jgi:hypothetical protein
MRLSRARDIKKIGIIVINQTPRSREARPQFCKAIFSPAPPCGTRTVISLIWMHDRPKGGSSLKTNRISSYFFRESAWSLHFRPSRDCCRAKIPPPPPPPIKQNCIVSPIIKHVCGTVYKTLFFHYGHTTCSLGQNTATKTASFFVMRTWRNSNKM